MDYSERYGIISCVKRRAKIETRRANDIGRVTARILYYYIILLLIHILLALYNSTVYGLLQDLLAISTLNVKQYIMAALQ